MNSEQTGVVIVGGGPNGIALANYMGLYNIPTIVLELSHDILPFPRAVGMDDEALRVLQTVGLAEPCLKDMIQDVPLRYYNGRGVCFAEVKPSARKNGWPMRNIFMQQLAEVTLREGLERFDNVDLRLGHELVELKQDEQSVTLKVKNSSGDLYSINADFVIGADGGRSTVRDLLGIKLQGVTHPRKWVVVDAVNDDLDAPYTALHADPIRPFVCIYLPYQHRRWEFMLFAGEEEEEMIQEPVVRNMIRRHIGDKADQLDLLRIRAYTHHSRVAENFCKGRVLLSGDAAHLTPPWAGQGLNSGLRDVGNIGWKVAAAAKGMLPASILSTYDLERRGHAIDLIALADNMGAILGLTDSVIAGVRDWVFHAIDGVPALREHLLEFKFKPIAQFPRGIVLHKNNEPRKESGVGQLFIQPNVEDKEGQSVKFDEVLGPWFSIVGCALDPKALLDADDLEFWAGLNTRYIQVNRSRSGRSYNDRLVSGDGTVAVEDVDGQLFSWFKEQDESIVILRPDRYVAAIVSPERLKETLKKLQHLLTHSHVF